MKKKFQATLVATALIGTMLTGMGAQPVFAEEAADSDFRRAIQDGISKVNIFTDINVAAVEAEFRKFKSMDKGIVDLIPAAVEAVKQETTKKMELFGSCGHAADGKGTLFAKNFTDKNRQIEEITRAVIEVMLRQLGK